MLNLVLVIRVQKRWTSDCSELYWRKGSWYGESREKGDTGLDREML